MNKFRKATLLISLSFVLFSLSLSTASDAGFLRTVAFSGDLAPGLTDGIHFSSFDTPVINNAGHTAYRGFLAGADLAPSNSNSIWSEGGGQGLKLIARAGTPAPGVPSGLKFTTISEISIPVLNNAGLVAFQSFLSDGNSSFSSGEGIWSGGPGMGLKLVARTGNQVNGTPSGVSFDSTRNPVLNDADQTAFGGRLSGTGVNSVNNEGIWLERHDGELDLVARLGDEAPGTSGGIYSRFFSHPSLNSQGQTAFYGFLSGALPDSLWLGNGNSEIELIARKGEHAPDTGSGVYFRIFDGDPALNNAGQTVFAASLIGTGVDSSNNTGIWLRESDGELHIVARSGNQIPGKPNGVIFAGIGTPVLNGAGQTVFPAGFIETEEGIGFGDGIWSQSLNGEFNLVAQQGDQAPGVPSGVTFDRLRIVSLNGAGQTAITGDVTGPGVSDNNDFGIWAQDHFGILKLIARTGDLLDVDDGPGVDLRTINFLRFAGFTGNEDSRPSSFNDRGQFVFSAAFTDGTSGVFVSNLVAVPEQSSLTLLALAGLAACACRRPQFSRI